jgi:Protein of unknown function (DUF3168)
MNGELAVYSILSNDASYNALVGGSEALARVYYEEAPQGANYPMCVISTQGVTPNHTKDGDSDFDFQYVQVLHLADTKNLAKQMAVLGRDALVISSASYGGVNIESIVFDDGDSFSERIVDRRLFTEEQIYKVFIKR